MGKVRPSVPSAAARALESLERRVIFALFGPDPSFGDGGRAAVSAAQVLHVLPDNKILVAGQLSTGPDNLDLTAFMWRLNPDGTIDTTFGGANAQNGRVEIGYREDPTLAGSRVYSTGHDGDDVEFIRALTLDGTPDPTFSGDGIADMPFKPPVSLAGPSARGHVMGAAPDGGILLFVSMDGRTAGNAFASFNQIAKLKPDGTIDTAFADNGFMQLAQPPTSLWTYVTSNGILVGKAISNGREFTRHKFDGEIDTSFGANGTATLPFTFDYIEEYPDGRLLAWEQVHGGETVARFRRLSPGGALDTSFGANGLLELPRAADFEGSAIVAIDPQDRLVVATSRTMYRISESGTIEPDPFGGLTSEDIGFGGRTEFDPQGRMLIAGSGPVLIRLDDLAPLEIGRDKRLYVHGDESADTVTIAGAANNQVAVTRNGLTTNFPAADVVGFALRLRDGNNSATVNVDLPTEVRTGAGHDTITTGDGLDDLKTGTGNDVLNIGDGNDLVRFGKHEVTSSATVTGGTGNKTITSDGGRLTVTLGVGNNIVNAADVPGNHISIDGGSNRVQAYGSGAVVEIGGDGNNDVSIYHGGNDPGPPSTVTTGNGRDVIQLSSAATVDSRGGDDAFLLNVFRAQGPVLIRAGDGNDSLRFGDANYDANATVFGGNGNDLLRGNHGTQHFYGNAGKDTLTGGIGSDLLSGGGGHDRLFGDGGNDRLYGGDGNDTLAGGAGHDRLFGHAGKDHLLGQAGNDLLWGGAANDRLYGNRGNDALWGEGGDDRLHGDYDSGTSTLRGGAGNDTLVARDNLIDQLFGDDGEDTAIADAEDDLDGIEND